MRRLLQVIQAGVVLLVLLVHATVAHGSISLLVEEPFGRFGAFNPTGHAAIYLSRVCADTPTRLRLCQPGEMGVVISRYHRVKGYDWLAVPLVPYLYAVDDADEIPQSATPALRARLRDRYRRSHLLDLVADGPNGETPKGEWIQLVGAAYDRRIYGFELATSPEQDARLVALLNDSHNRSHFNLLYRNCADFARSILRSTYPGSIPRNTLADFWLTTPKHLANLVTKFGERTPEADFRTFQIAQVPGSIKRSRNVHGIAESLVRSKKYIVPLAFLSPTTALSLTAAYLGDGRFRMPHDAPELAFDAQEEHTMQLEEDTVDLGAISDGKVAGMCPVTETIPEDVPTVGAQ